MIIARLNALKTKGNFSWQDLSDMTGIPVPTIRKTFSGETVNPSFEVVSKLLIAMGENIPCLTDLEEVPAPPPAPKDTPEKSSEKPQDTQELPAQMQALYEARIADLWRIIDKITVERRILFISMLTLILILMAFVAYLFLDGMHGNWGFFQY